MNKQKLVFKLDKKGVQAMLKGPEMYQAIKDTTDRIHARCGPDYYTHTQIGRKRALGMVYAGNIQAQRDNSENNTLLKALR